MKVRYITEQSELQELALFLRQPAIRLLGCDVETLGLNPRQDKLRLLSLAYREDRAFVIDAFKTDITPLFPILENKVLVFHNGLFDLQFLWMLGFRPGQVRDNMLMSQVRYAGRKTDEGKRLSHSLEAVVQRELGITLPKSLQTSDWSGELTQQQIEYAGRDAALLLPIDAKMRQKVETFGLGVAVDIEHRALPSVVWMSVQGVSVWVSRWEELTQQRQGDVCFLEEVLCQIIEEDLGSGRVVNWSSPKQIQKLFAELGDPLFSTTRSRLMESNHRLAKTLLKYREVNKLTTTYGMKWIGKAVNGRIYIQWLQCPTATGRMAASTPNLQQVPRNKEYRECICAPKGRKLICADLSQIEARIVAKLANEGRMIDIFQSGGDIHTETAKLILGKREITKDDRQIAKSAVFALLYGAGAARFQMYAKTTYGIEMSLDEAKRIREAFFKTYPKLGIWHRSHGDETINTRTLIGRWRCDVEKYTEKNNSPSQGSGADMLKLALALMWERRNESGGYAPIAAIHDEILAEGPEETAEQAKEWVIRCMVDASAFMLWPCPTGVEAVIAQDWGSK